MNIDTYLALVGLIIAFVSLFFGGSAYRQVNKAKNKVQIEGSNNTIEQANTIIKNGIEAVAVMEMVMKATKIEAKEIEQSISTYKEELSNLEKRIVEMPRIRCIPKGANFPSDLRGGDIVMVYE